jgi:DNA-3-methyladenine glycosylase
MDTLALLTDTPFSQQLARTGWTPELLAYPTPQLAPCLLGQGLVVNTPQGGGQGFTLTEVEAYTQDDPACHAYQRHPATGYKGRATLLFAQPGTVYVYLIYGMYHCVNIITEPEGRGAAVLLRGLAPKPTWQGGRVDGPGRLCKTLGVTTQAHNATSLFEKNPVLQLVAQPLVLPQQVQVSPRIGISKGKDLLWRFYLNT